MSKLDELRKEYEDLRLGREHARIELRKEWAKEHPSEWYRATHNIRDGKSTGLVWAMVVFVMVMAVVVSINAVAPNVFYKPGDQMYHLNSGDSYECPHCLTHSTTHYMVTYDGRYYYCPQCLNIMGHLDVGAKH